MIEMMDSILLRRKRLIVLLTVVLLFTFFYTSFISYRVTRDAISHNIKYETLPLVSDNIYSEIQQDLIKPINNSSMMSNDEFLVDWVNSGEKHPEEVVKYLKRIIDEYGYFTSFFVSEKTGNYYYYDGILKQISPEDSHDVWYYRFKEQDREYVLDVDTNEAANGTVTIFINHRLEDKKGNFLGVTGVGLELVTFGDLLSAYRQQYGHEVYLIDSKGLIQAHSDNEKVLRVNIRDMEGIGGLAENILAAKESAEVYEYEVDHETFVISARYFPEFDWFLIVMKNQTDSLLAARVSLVLNVLIGILVTILNIVFIVLSINRYHGELEALAEIDELTGLYNRRKFHELFQREIRLSRRFKYSFSVLFIDIDHFKQVNDQYGHLTGDLLLKSVADVFRGQVREIDVLARWGGEEFVIMMHRTGEFQAQTMANRLRKAVANMKIVTDQGVISRTISIGICSVFAGRKSMDEILQLADEAMLRAKNEGRNRVCVAETHRRMRFFKSERR